MRDLIIQIIGIVFFGLVFIFFVITISLGVLHGITGQEYITDNIVECNDKDGDLIVGDLICYDILFCSDKVKFMNEPSCEEVLQ